MSEYGNGYKQKKIMELGEAGKLTDGDLRKLYGFTKAMDELDKLIALGLVEIDKETMDGEGVNADTKLIWLKK